jgi:hypothetical protein
VVLDGEAAPGSEDVATAELEGAGEVDPTMASAFVLQQSLFCLSVYRYFLRNSHCAVLKTVT